ncbi:MAG: tRNA (guanosine(37)-N1)-methyltransferase TrmD [Clostridia bacterium]|nr:tRNA (guanosine(37)-N1)-methyltransferase TrmD [Clostridia bacterium]
MRFDILTLFPDMMRAILDESIIGRAQNSGILEINCINIRDFAGNKHNSVDDYPYGGGFGMLMQAPPIYRAYESVAGEDKPYTVYMSPQGRVLTQDKVVELSKKDRIVILCGHYEGVDERVIEEIVDEEISIGDYVLTGGELPAAVLVDSVARMVEGVLPQSESFEEESIYSGLLEHPQYTRPPVFMGREVPEVLMSGHHANIEKWKRKEALKRTYIKRPDLLKSAELTDKDRKMLDEIIGELESEA